MSPLRPSVPSTGLSPLHGSLSLYSPLSPLQPSVPSEKSETSETALLFREMFCKMRFVKTPRVIVIYFVQVIITMITQAKYSAIIAK